MNQPPLRVAIVSREYPPFFGGGIGTYARWIVPALAQAGIRVHVITEAHNQSQPRIEVDGLATVHRVPMGVGKGGWANAAARFSIDAGHKVSQLWRSGQIDVVEFAECEASGFATLLLGNPKRRIPTIVQLHTPSEQLFVLRSFWSRTLDPTLIAYFQSERMAIRLADEVLAPSQFIADWAHKQYTLDKNPTVIPYATGPLPPPCPPPDPNQPITVLYAGRIEPRKGVESLLHAWKAVVAEHPNAILRLAGADTSGAPDGGSMRAYLNQLLDGSTRPSVVFLGRLSPEALAMEYAGANLCVIPSLWENFPNTCIESMSNARAVLVGDAGGMREMIGTTRAGLTFRAGDEQDLACQLRVLIQEGPRSLAERGSIAYERIANLCDPHRIAALRAEHYRGVIRGSHAPNGHQNDPRTTGMMRDSWRNLEQVISGNSPEFDLPKLSPMVERWVDRVEIASC